MEKETCHQKNRTRILPKVVEVVSGHRRQAMQLRWGYILGVV